MMSWGRKKPSSSRSSSSISRDLAIPWLLKFKGKNTDGSEPKPAKEKLNERQQDGSARSQGDDSDAFWRLAIGEESFKGSERYESGSGFDIPAASCRSCGSYIKMLLQKEESDDVKMKIKEICGYPEIFPEIQMYEQGKETVIMEDQTWVRKDQKVLEKKLIKPQNLADSRKYTSAASKNIRNNNLKARDENSAYFAAQRGGKDDKPYPEYYSFQRQKLKEMKIKEVKLKAEQQQRKSHYIHRDLSGTRTKQNLKVRVLSPRKSSKVEKCRVRALEDIKKANKLKMQAEEERVRKESIPENFAMVKLSSDPQKDFRDSMVEMILENRIQRPPELEELLVCYLTLNADEYHDIIIKVFQQVWYDLNNATVINQSRKHEYM